MKFSCIISVCFQAWKNLLHRTQFFGREILIARPIMRVKLDVKNQSVCPNEKQLETLLFALYIM